MCEFNRDENEIIKDALNKSLEKSYEYLLDEIKKIADACNDFALMNHDEKSEKLYALSYKNKLKIILKEF